VAIAGNQARDLDADQNSVQLFAQLPHAIAVAATGPGGWRLDPTTNPRPTRVLQQLRPVGHRPRRPRRQHPLRSIPASVAAAAAVDLLYGDHVALLRVRPRRRPDRRRLVVELRHERRRTPMSLASPRS
jgi:hypothetical protein